MHSHQIEPTPTTASPEVSPTPAFADILRLALAAKHLQLAEATLRHLRFYSEERKASDGHTIPGNGFARAFLKLGRSVYVDIPVFVEIWRSQQTTGAPHG
jgi:hypothetical protein